MNLRAYVSFVELLTKIASVIPFVIGVTYSLYRYGELNLINVLIMFISMITFDMATTAINNYCDYKNELEHLKGDYKGKNPMFQYGISKNVALVTIGILLSVATLLGIVLTLRTNILVLLIGAICFFVGIFYTFGPIPISRMPLGELFSGVFMGLFITFLTVYVNIIDYNFFGIYLDGVNIVGNFNIFEGIGIFIISIPLITGISNIMLSNNICDLEEDIKVKRFTLPYYIGKKRAIILYKLLYYIGYLAIIVGVLIQILPRTALLSVLTLIVVNKNIKLFEEKQIKSETFVLSVKNFALSSSVYVITIIIGTILK
ncbi:MAG: 1,4-dihydroxy-2-naphthoate polyprenyltransferase [Clostridium sp.]|uniref:1,4-dihydroxy-2-naphthoate polyprenyltransferase n=1 Tax=Clostridium sp. TaxID=1506 RepID=UPI003F415991